MPKVDLLDFWRGNLSIRRLLLLIERLPRESATVQKLAGAQARWGATDYLLADLIEATSGRHYSRPGETERAVEESNARRARFDARQRAKQSTEGGGDG